MLLKQQDKLHLLYYWVHNGPLRHEYQIWIEQQHILWILRGQQDGFQRHITNFGLLLIQYTVFSPTREGNVEMSSQCV